MNEQIAIIAQEESFERLKLARELYEYEWNLKLIQHLQPKFGIDGDKYYYLYGENLQVGIAGFGSTAYEAMNNFSTNFHSSELQ